MIKSKGIFETQGMVLVLSGPSGSGKSTLQKALLEHDSRMVFSVSATTRPPRPGERDGVDYIFLSEDAFSAHVEQGDFLEHTHLFGYRYGTLRSHVTQTLAQGYDMIFDISADGAAHMKLKLPLETVRVLILPPSLEVLERRLHTRENGDTAASLAQRFQEAQQEIQKCLDYDYVVINVDAVQASRELMAIVEAERHKMCRQKTLKNWVTQHFS